MFFIKRAEFYSNSALIELGGNQWALHSTLRKSREPARDLIGISSQDPLTIHAFYHSIERLNSEAVVKQLHGELGLPVRSWYPAESGLPPTFLLVHLVKRTRGWMCQRWT